MVAPPAGAIRVLCGHGPRSIDPGMRRRQGSIRRRALLLVLGTIAVASPAGANPWRTLGPFVPAVPRAVAAPVFHGIPTPSYPAVVGLAVLNQDQTVGFCSGSLIAADVVLTAGHCLASTPIAAVALVYPDGVTEVDYDAIAYAVHPDFQPRVAAYADLALLQLGEPVADVAPLPLASAEPQRGTFGTIVGYGADGRGDGGIKREGTVRLKRCPRAIKRAGVAKGDLDTSLCWRPKKPRRQDTCQGDSGGPLLVDGAVAGVTSGGFPRCPGRVSWDTSVALFVPWITEVMGP